MKMTIHMLLFFSENNAMHRCAKAPQMEHYFDDLLLNNILFITMQREYFFTLIASIIIKSHMFLPCFWLENSLKSPLAIRKVPLALRKLP